MKKTYQFLSILLPLFAAQAKADDMYLREEISQLRDDIVVLQRQMYREKAEVDAPKAEVSDFHIRLGEYEQMIRDMNGKVESIEHRLSTLEKKMEMIDKDIELRFSQMKKHVATATPQQKKKNTSVAPSTLPPKELYEKALNDLKANKLSDADTKFSQFLTTYPKDTLAGNAQYWLGEVYYKQQNFAKAAVAFKEGYSKYPEGVKGPDCLLKLGLSMKALGKKEEACTAFINLPTIFGKVNQDISSRAKKEAEILACK